MGSYGILRLQELELLSFNGPPEIALELFCESDRREYERQNAYWETGDDEEIRLEWAVEYSCPAKYIRDRLEARGYSLNRCREAFEVGIQELIERELGPFWTNCGDHLNGYEYDSQGATEFSKTFTFKRLLVLLKQLAHGSPSAKSRNWKKARRLEHEIITNEDNSFFGFVKVDILHAFRALVEVCPEGEFTLDLSELVENGWLPDSDPLCSQEPHFMILTEGTSDHRILSAVIKYRYPHLAPYYSFLDFDLSKLGGGASQVVMIIKAFVAARFSKKLIAVFDNDAASSEALRNLSIDLPPNMKIFKLPELEFAKSYPSIGPQGESEVNINGLAVSIELFLGKNILTNSTGKLRPVVWSSYLKGVDKYQGEIIEKNEIQEDFLQTLLDSRRVIEQDWSAMDVLFKELFNVFANSAPTGFSPYN